MLNWHGGNDYELDGPPSQFVANTGKQFLWQSFQGGLIIDAGCWEGRNVPPLIDIVGSHSQVVAIDLPEAPWNELIRKFPQVTMQRCSLTRIPLENQSVGGVLCWRVLHHLYRPGELANALGELNRVMKFNAPLAVAVRLEPDACCFQLSLKRCPNGANGSRDDLYFSCQVFQRIFALAGFSMQHLSTIQEAEIIDGRVVSNNYLAGLLIKRHAALANLKEEAIFENI